MLPELITPLCRDYWMIFEISVPVTLSVPFAFTVVVVIATTVAITPLIPTAIALLRRINNGIQLRLCQKIGLIVTTVRLDLSDKSAQMVA